MPIYSYRCESCGHQQDVLQKMSDPLLVDCPSCGLPAYRKQVTAAGFQLKGSGWYVTDFRNPQAKEASKNASKPEDGAGGKSGEAAPADTKSTEPSSNPVVPAKESTAAAKSDAPPAKPTAAPAPTSGTP